MTEGEVEGKYVIVKREKADRVCLLKELTYGQSSKTYVSTGPGVGGPSRARLRPPPAMLPGPKQMLVGVSTLRHYPNVSPKRWRHSGYCMLQFDNWHKLGLRGIGW